MTNISLCRICLAHDKRMYTTTATPLQEFYEKNTNKAFKSSDGTPSCLCYICHHLLKKCFKFIESAIRADEVLQELHKNGFELTEKSITTIDKKILFCTTFERSATQYTDTGPIEEDIVKDEQLDVKKEVHLDTNGAENEENGKVEIDIDLHQHDFESEEDSEDDVPLKIISNKNEEKRMDKNRVKKKIGHLKKTKKVLKPDAREIILTREEQMQQMLERAKSLNYLHSPHKCDLCYKGFVDQRAFENHKEKHDERSGPYECEICHMRYRTTRHLRTHTDSSHARQYACNKCSHRAHTANQAREHEKWHNGFTYECQLCGQKFRKPTSYLTHMRKRHPTEHVCETCGECFVGSHGLLMHKSKAHWRQDEKPPEQDDQKYCAECNIRFVSLDAWQRHILRSVRHALGNDTSTTCLSCGSVVAGTSLRAHVRTHVHSAPVKRAPHAAPLPCPECEINFTNRSRLHAHINRIHLGLKYNKNIVCEVCGKKCTSNATLKYHQRTHTGERPFSCAQCSKRFADKNQLRIHIRTHTGERPYCCAACGKRFSQKPALNRHYRVHTGAKPYDCQFCSKTFSQSNSLKLHVNTIHLKLPHSRRKAQNEQAAPPDS